MSEILLLPYHFISQMGSIVLFASQAFEILLYRSVNWKRVISQMYEVGVHSLVTTVSTGLFVGAIMAIQINVQLVDFGAQGFLGGLSTSATLRNVGPVLIAFLLSGKVGAFTTAELGTMKVTEQWDAIRCLGTDPIEYIVVPRLIAITLSSFLLLVVGLMVTVLGGVLFSSSRLGVNASQYIMNIPNIVSFWSLGIGIVKSFVFGALIGVVACYKGYTVEGGAEGVGRGVKSGAVTSLVWIVIVDYGLSVFFSFLQDVFGANLL